VRRIVSRQIPKEVVIAGPARKVKRPGNKGDFEGMTNWRYITGSFQVKIPVAADEALLYQEENTLAILKWRLQNMSPAYRWYPVLNRLISYVTRRVSGFGGDPSTIEPSQLGIAHRLPVSSHETRYEGKICEIIFDCFGDFEGFTLESCSGRECFKSCEKPIEEICLRACKERFIVAIYADKKKKIQKIIICCHAGKTRCGVGTCP